MFSRPPRFNVRSASSVACAAILAGGMAVGLSGQPPVASGASSPGQGKGKRDKTPPSTPTNLHASVATSAAGTFVWDASSDNVRVVGYDVYVGSRTTPARVTSLSYVA